MTLRKIVLVTSFAIWVGNLGAAVAAETPPVRTPNGLALTPPMGWNHWNKFECNVTEKIIRDQADAMVSSGMRAAGYQYIVVDDCWHGPRDSNGKITADTLRFPSGIKSLADYVHDRHLKFGIYSDAGRMTCAKRPGSQGNEFQDARTYAEWGVDYLKYDWCNTDKRNSEEAYALMSDALRASGRDIVFSLCEWGSTKPWLWARNIGNLWRSTSDIQDMWKRKPDDEPWQRGVLDIIDEVAELGAFVAPGYWNDPDMLEVGNGGMTDTEYRTHFSMWAMFAAPLMAGDDMSVMSEATKAILLNRDVIAVDQDPLGVAGRRVIKEGDREVWVRPLVDGGRAVILFNRSEAAEQIAIEWPALGYPKSLNLRAKDLWSGASMPVRGRLVATVAPHGVAMYRLAM